MLGLLYMETLNFISPHLPNSNARCLIWSDIRHAITIEALESATTAYTMQFILDAFSNKRKKSEIIAVCSSEKQDIGARVSTADRWSQRSLEWPTNRRLTRVSAFALNKYLIISEKKLKRLMPIEKSI